MKLFFILFIMISQYSYANKIEKFFAQHTVSSSHLYCQKNIIVSKCRVLMRFKNNKTGKIAQSFQMAFINPSANFAATELFLKTSKKEKFQQYIDKSFDGKFLGEKGSLLRVKVSDNKIAIKKWPATPTIIGELSFDKNFAVLDANMVLEDGSNKQILINYPKLY